MSANYVCTNEANPKALVGPMTSDEAVAWIDAQDDPPKYCNQTRWALAKNGRYPNNKAGDAALARDIQIFDMLENGELEEVARMDAE